MEIKLGNCSTFSAHLVKPGNTDYRCTQAVIFGGRESRWQGGSSFCNAWLARWRRCDHAKFTIYFQPPHQTSLQSMRLPSLRMLSSHQPPFYSLQREKFQNTFWWLKNTTSPLYHYRNNKGKFIKSSRCRSEQCHYRALSPSLRSVPRNFGCVSKCGKVDTTSRDETAHSNQSQSWLKPWGESSLVRKELVHQQFLV